MCLPENEWILCFTIGLSPCVNCKEMKGKLPVLHRIDRGSSQILQNGDRVLSKT